MKNPEQVQTDKKNLGMNKFKTNADGQTLFWDRQIKDFLRRMETNWDEQIQDTQTDGLKCDIYVR